MLMFSKYSVKVLIFFAATGSRTNGLALSFNSLVVLSISGMIKCLFA